MQLLSAYEIGERVKIAVILTAPIFGYVRAVTFTSSKVRYAIWIKEADTTLHNIDSAFIEKARDDQAGFIVMPEDNYS